MVVNLTTDTGIEYYSQPLSLDDAIDKALDTEIDYGHHDNGNSWYRTTGNRYGITERGIKQALRNRNLI